MQRHLLTHLSRPFYLFTCLWVCAAQSVTDLSWSEESVMVWLKGKLGKNQQKEFQMLLLLSSQFSQSKVFNEHINNLKV